MKEEFGGLGWFKYLMELRKIKAKTRRQVRKLCDKPWKRWRPDNVQAMSPVPQLHVVLVRLGPIDIKDQTKRSSFKHF